MSSDSNISMTNNELLVICMTRVNIEIEDEKEGKKKKKEKIKSHSVNSDPTCFPNVPRIKSYPARNSVFLSSGTSVGFLALKCGSDKSLKSLSLLSISSDKIFLLLPKALIAPVIYYTIVLKRPKSVCDKRQDTLLTLLFFLTFSICWPVDIFHHDGKRVRCTW